MSARTKSSITSRRRSSGAAPRLLGAVKLQSPLSTGGDAGSPMSCSSEPPSSQATPQNQSPLAGRPAVAGAAAPAAAVDRLTEFSRQLNSSRSSDKWLEEQEMRAPSSCLPGAPPQRQQAAAPSPLSQQAAVDSAATQIVHKALRRITDQAPLPAAAGAAAMAEEMARRQPSFDSQTILDKASLLPAGIDAISGVGKLMEGFAITLDTVIGQAFEDWGSSMQPSRMGRPARRAAPAAAAAGAGAAQGAAPRAAALGAATSRQTGSRSGWDEFEDKENAARAARAAGKQQAAASGAPAGQGAVAAASRQPRLTSFMSKLDAASEQEVAEWRRRAQQLSSELQRVRAQQEEHARLKLQYDKLESDLRQASTAASRLAQENCALKSQGVDLAVGASDPLAAQQVAGQMEALLSEKSRLAQENDRLLRENTGLQELLEFTLQHHSQLAGDGELFGYDDEGEEEAGLLAGEAGALLEHSPPPFGAQGGVLAASDPGVLPPPTAA